MLYQKLVKNVLYPLDRIRSGDGFELRYRREFERSQFLAPEAIRDMQFTRMKKIIVHAYSQCPFYKNAFDQAGVKLEYLQSLSDLADFPILEKRHIQADRDRMVATNWPKADLMPNLTGGSTGTPLSFYVSRERFQSRAAATWRHNRWAGYEVGDKAGVLWGAARDLPPAGWKKRLRNALIDRTRVLNTANITEKGMADYLTELKNFRPKVLLAYANSLGLFARFIREQGLVAYQPQSIITSAEVLEPETRSLIEDVFGCRVFNRYGCREVSVIASECEIHDGMHVMAEGLFVEIVRDGRPVEPGELGEVLVTDLLNYAMPLIRYRIGDMAVLDDSPCPCGRGLPRLNSIAGRVTDFLVGADGRLVSGAALTVVMVAKRPNLGQVQIWQDEPGKVLFKLCPPPGTVLSPDDFAFLSREAQAYLGDGCTVTFETVDQIPKEPSGKYRFCISNVEKTHTI